MTDLNTTIDRASPISRGLANVLEWRLKSARSRYTGRLQSAASATIASAATPKTPLELWEDAWRFSVDAAQRSVLFRDALRERGNNRRANQQAGRPTLLHQGLRRCSTACAPRV